MQRLRSRRIDRRVDECSKWNDSTSGWHSSRGTSFFCTDFRYANRAVSLGKMSRNLRCTTGSCGWCAIVVLSFAPLRIVNNDVSGSIRLAEFFDSPLPVSSWLIETVVEGTTACNCSFRETKVLPGFCARRREPWFSVTSIANVFLIPNRFLVRCTDVWRRLCLSKFDDGLFFCDTWMIDREYFLSCDNLPMIE